MVRIKRKERNDFGSYTTAYKNTKFLSTDTRSWQVALYFCVPIKVAAGQHFLCGSGEEFNKMEEKLSYPSLRAGTTQQTFTITYTRGKQRFPWVSSQTAYERSSSV